MPIRLAVLTVVALLVGAAPASARSKTETVTSGQVTAAFSYEFNTRDGIAGSFRNLRVTIDRAGVRLVDDANPTNCRENCFDAPAGGASDDAPSLKLRDLDRDGEPELLVDLYTGGANCCFFTISWRYDSDRNVYVKKILRPGLSFPYVLRDVNQNGEPEFHSMDYRFAYKYGSNVDTPRPLRIFSWDRGRLVDVTIAFPRLAAREAAEYYRAYLRIRRDKDANVRGLLAAYLADSYNAGNGRTAWRRVIAAYRRGEVDRRSAVDSGPFGRRYLVSLRKFLRKLGYLRGS